MRSERIGMLRVSAHRRATASTWRCLHATVALCGVGWFSPVALAADPSQRYVFPGPNGQLVYELDARGNRVPDFSFAGYRQGNVPIPDVPARREIEAEPGDATQRIQKALDELSERPLDDTGFRGALLLKSGSHEVSGRLRIRASGIVLRGEPGTVLRASGISREAVVQVSGVDDQVVEPAVGVADYYVPVGATKLTLERAVEFQVGDTVEILHESTAAWIAAVVMNRFPSRDGQGSWQDWKPGTLDLCWRRTIAAVQGNQITLEVPLTYALDGSLSRATVARYRWPGQLAHVGIENLQIVSAFERSNPHDEQHAWDAISFRHTHDAWVRDVHLAHFAGSAVHIDHSCQQITVHGCRSTKPVSELGGYRRHTFYTAGQMTLFEGCFAEEGRHDFAVGYLATGPNVFVDCTAEKAHSWSGPIESWATGVLYDNVTIDGGGLALTNRETDGHGVGWAAANCLLWQCTAPVVTCRSPPTAQNWSIGCWGEFVGDAAWRSMNEFQQPESLFRAQRAERLRGLRPQVAQLRSRHPPPPSSPPLPQSPRELALSNGWLTIHGELLVGTRTGTQWWRGHLLPERAAEAGLGVTRFVPGRTGPGYTDDLNELTDRMQAGGQGVLEHHWGLWYDRRRDDHQMVRRSSGEVWPPFYEQPWDRSGRGTAWDGLSRYDLTRFNAWYFARLDEFAQQCTRKGLVLFQHMYFQHNLLEAGAHWADFPWRPANCLQDTGFLEPPPYENRKRIHLAEAFYDVSHPVRRGLHRKYIRHCLDVLGKHRNVVFFPGEEFTGPQSFVAFWLETIAEWQRERGTSVLIGLACTKDVQDAILANPQLEPLVRVIDLKYWWYTADGSLYAPPGGAGKAPRQQLREWSGSRSRSDASIARQVAEYRQRFPDKAVIHSLEPADPWLVLAAGGSIPRLPPSINPALRQVVPQLRPCRTTQSEATWVLTDDSGLSYFVAAAKGPIRLRLNPPMDAVTVSSICPDTGQLVRSDLVHPAEYGIDLGDGNEGGIWLVQKR